MSLIGGRVSRLVMVCLIIEVLYLIIVNTLLGSSLLKNILNRRPDKHEYSWTSAWSIVPGVIHVRGFQMQNRSRSVAWTLLIDKARFRTALWALPFRTMRIYRLKAFGVKVDIEKNRLFHKPKSQEIVSENNNSDDMPSSINDLPTELNVSRPGWRIDIRKADFDKVKSIKIDDYSWEGEGLVQGRLDMVTRKELYIPRLRANLKNGQLSFLNTIIADKLQVRTTGNLDPFIPRQNPGMAFLDYFAGNTAVEGNIKNLDLLEYYLKNTDWLSVHGNGQINTNLFFDHGFISDRSHLYVRSDDLSVEMKGWEFRGFGVIDGEVRKNNGDLETVLCLDLNEIALHNIYRESEMVSLPNASLTIKGKNIKLTEDSPEMAVELDIIETAIDDLSKYNELFPPSSGFKIIPGGYGSLATHAEITNRLSQVELTLAGKEIGLNLGGETFKGNCQFRTIMKTDDPTFRRIHLEDTELHIDNMHHPPTSAKERDSWSAGIIISDTEMVWDDVIHLNSAVQVTLSHSQPLIDIFLNNKKHWFDDLIHFENIQGDAKLQLDSSSLKLHKVTLLADGMVSEGFGIKPFTVYASSLLVDLNRGFSNLEIKFNIPDSTIPDLSIINDFLPKRSGFFIFPGTPGRIQADVNIENGAGKSRLNISGRKTEFALMETRFKGDPEIRLELNSKNVLSGRFDIADTIISLDHVDSVEMNADPDWWIGLEAIQGELVFGKPIEFAGLLDLKMRDTGPILTMFEDRNRIISSLGDIFMIENIRGEGFIILDRNGFGIDNLDLKGEQLDVKAKLSLSQSAKTGILYVKFHGLSLGIEMLNGKINYKLIHPRRWFDRYPWNRIPALSLQN